MQPQFFWGTNSRAPLQPTHRGWIERLRRDGTDILRQELKFSVTDPYLSSCFASYLLFRLQSFPRRWGEDLVKTAIVHGNDQNALMQVCVRQTPHPLRLGPTWVQEWVRLDTFSVAAGGKSSGISATWAATR